MPSLLNSEINPTRCNNCVYSSQWLPSWGHIQHMYSWWWVELSPETYRVKPLRRINAIVASCWLCIDSQIKVLLKNNLFQVPSDSPIERGSNRPHSVENLFGRGCGSVARQTTERMSERMNDSMYMSNWNPCEPRFMTPLLPSTIYSPFGSTDTVDSRSHYQWLILWLFNDICSGAWFGWHRIIIRFW